MNVIFKNKPAGDNVLHGGMDKEQLEALSKIGGVFEVWSHDAQRWVNRVGILPKQHKFNDNNWYKIKE